MQSFILNAFISTLDIHKNIDNNLRLIRTRKQSKDDANYDKYISNNQVIINFSSNNLNAERNNLEKAKHYVTQYLDKLVKHLDPSLLHPNSFVILSNKATYFEYMLLKKQNNIKNSNIKNSFLHNYTDGNRAFYITSQIISNIFQYRKDLYHIMLLLSGEDYVNFRIISLDKGYNQNQIEPPLQINSNMYNDILTQISVDVKPNALSKHYIYKSDANAKREKRTKFKCRQLLLLNKYLENAQQHIPRRLTILLDELFGVVQFDDNTVNKNVNADTKFLTTLYNSTFIVMLIGIVAELEKDDQIQFININKNKRFVSYEYIMPYVINNAFKLYGKYNVLFKDANYNDFAMEYKYKTMRAISESEFNTAMFLCYVYDQYVNNIANITNDTSKYLLTFFNNLHCFIPKCPTFEAFYNHINFLSQDSAKIKIFIDNKFDIFPFVKEYYSKHKTLLNIDSIDTNHQNDLILRIFEQSLILHQQWYGKSIKIDESLKDMFYSTNAVLNKINFQKYSFLEQSTDNFNLFYKALQENNVNKNTGYTLCEAEDVIKYDKEEINATALSHFDESYFNNFQHLNDLNVIKAYPEFKNILIAYNDYINNEGVCSQYSILPSLSFFLTLKIMHELEFKERTQNFNNEQVAEVEQYLKDLITIAYGNIIGWQHNIRGQITNLKENDKDNQAKIIKNEMLYLQQKNDIKHDIQKEEVFQNNNNPFVEAKYSLTQTIQQCRNHKYSDDTSNGNINNINNLFNGNINANYAYNQIELNLIPTRPTKKNQAEDSQNQKITFFDGFEI